MARSARILAMANQKGGVAKTTSSLNVAVALREKGMRVLVVDLDPQSNLSMSQGIDVENLDLGMFDVLVRSLPITDIVQVCEIDVAPAGIELAGAELALSSMIGRERALARALQPVAGAYDYLIMDTPPSLGLLTINALTAANEVFVPIQAEYYALEGVTMLWDNIAMVRQYLNPRVSITGVLLTMYDHRTNLSRDVADEVRRHFPDLVFSSVIPRSVRVSEAPSFHKTVIDYDRNSIGAIAYREAALEFAERGVY